MVYRLQIEGLHSWPVSFGCVSSRTAPWRTLYSIRCRLGNPASRPRPLIICSTPGEGSFGAKLFSILWCNRGVSCNIHLLIRLTRVPRRFNFFGRSVFLNPHSWSPTSRTPGPRHHCRESGYRCRSSRRIIGRLENEDSSFEIFDVLVMSKTSFWNGRNFVKIEGASTQQCWSSLSVANPIS